MNQAEERISQMNKEAYQSVLRALFAKNTSNAETMKLMLKLRKELNVTSDEHKEWLQELIKARNEGTLGQLLQSSLAQTNPTPAAATGNGWAVQAPINVPPLIGYKVQRYWPGEGEWCEGIVTDYRERDGLYCITYNLGKKDESMEHFDIARAEAIGDAQRSYYQQTPDKIDLRRYSSTRAYQNSVVLNPNKSRRKSLEPKSGSKRAVSLS
ncbi:hypothetical protein DUNSADRAFT_5423 [Dunaliella salina]|uniref:ENT domain-containing protein n=1 Tax=Dunaliella salina TaxID=3046 RepID=A0ABQ7GQB9_DUNSA|nr:hypothetical protein DUNSADRAFT_5423 [Dunaliella salina]|eukprot:KAF5836796.1 hypothetical protein DUNSADRAFT_5423 [Dunaliella salina]